MAIEIAELTPLVQVFDMPTAVAFYAGVLGFEVTAQSAPGDSYDWALLTLGGSALMLNTLHEAHARPAAPDPVRVAAHGDTTFYITCDSVTDIHAHLRARGIDVPPPKVAPYGMLQLELIDPDGYRVCFQHRA
jgi:catechol 2,3-dioxygenase-like lactoylglutathione lyase family enzyme